MAAARWALRGAAGMTDRSGSLQRMGQPMMSQRCNCDSGLGRSLCFPPRRISLKRPVPWYPRKWSWVTMASDSVPYASQRMTTSGVPPSAVRTHLPVVPCCRVTREPSPRNVRRSVQCGCVTRHSPTTLQRGKMSEGASDRAVCVLPLTGGRLRGDSGADEPCVSVDVGACANRHEVAKRTAISGTACVISDGGLLVDGSAGRCGLPNVNRSATRGAGAAHAGAGGWQHGT